MRCGWPISREEFQTVDEDWGTLQCLICYCDILGDVSGVFFRSVTAFRIGGAEVTKVRRFVEIGQARMFCSVTKVRGGRWGDSNPFPGKICSSYKMGGGHTMAQLVEVLYYKPEGCGFDSRLVSLEFFICCRSHYVPGVTQLVTEMCTRNIFER